MKRVKCNLAVLMAQKEISSMAELRRRIEAKGFTINLRTIYRLYHNTGNRTDHDTIEIICNTLDCSVGDLFILEHEKGEE